MVAVVAVLLSLGRNKQAAPRGMKILLPDPNGPFDVTTLTMKLLLVDDQNVVRETRANALTAEEGIDLVMVATHSVADLTRLAVRSGLIEM